MNVKNMTKCEFRVALLEISGAYKASEEYESDTNWTYLTEYWEPNWPCLEPEKYVDSNQYDTGDDPPIPDLLGDYYSAIRLFEIILDENPDAQLMQRLGKDSSWVMIESSERKYAVANAKSWALAVCLAFYQYQAGNTVNITDLKDYEK